MAKRSETAERKNALLGELRGAQRAAAAAPPQNQPVLSQRELCARFGLSAFTVSQLMLQLEREGVLYTVPRVGTFLGHPQEGKVAPYLIIRPEGRAGSFLWLMQSGFEARLGQLGASSLALTAEQALEHRERGELPLPCGVFETTPSDLGAEFAASGVPHVAFSSEEVGAPAYDSVDFDNEEGGRQATHHLLRMGHRHIAYLALHDGGPDVGRFQFSVEREEGWLQAMSESGQATAGMAFHPAQNSPGSSELQTEVAAKVAQSLLGYKAITAVVAVNSFAARGLLVALRATNWPAAKWPAVVCFDSPAEADSVLSCLQLPWDKLGQEAAQLLCDRKSGRLQGPPCRRLVTMQLIPRLTCQRDWAASPLAHRRATIELAPDQ